ncbi:unnamed protein product [Phaedon cochleariae]|uniref:Pyroglutamyl-peptidase I n=1 Tax=Phaedon cochleariae TaxID=80249 RepID=A0A9P0GTF0_PHACE|nr:unnamed protein product [Phaedon cochleariae]
MSDIVLVTGFGPFQDHKVNASWEAVKLLPANVDGMDIVIQEIPVVYDHVESKVPSLWKEYNPNLVIHVGVSSLAEKLTIETCAYRDGYIKGDCTDTCHSTGTASCEGDACIFTGIDVRDISDKLNHSGKILTCVSQEAGRYLCEFTYYTSLNINPSRTLFVHVPPLEKPYTASELADGILEVIKLALKQLRKDDGKSLRLDAAS